MCNDGGIILQWIFSQKIWTSKITAFQTLPQQCSLSTPHGILQANVPDNCMQVNFFFAKLIFQQGSRICVGTNERQGNLHIYLQNWSSTHFSTSKPFQLCFRCKMSNGYMRCFLQWVEIHAHMHLIQFVVNSETLMHYWQQLRTVIYVTLKDTCQQ